MKASIYFRDFNGISQRHRHELRLRVQLGVHLVLEVDDILPIFCTDWKWKNGMKHG